MKKSILIFASIALFSLLLLELCFDFKQQKPLDFRDQVWLHHGRPENSLAGVLNGMEQGFQGIELDVYYLENENRVVVTHDLPVTGAPTDLEDIFAAVGPTQVNLWLDYQNASPGTNGKFEALLKSLEKKYGMQERYFVESPECLAQVLLSWDGINTVLWVQAHPGSRISYLRTLMNKFLIVVGNFVAISLEFETYDDRTQKTYEHVSKLIFTVNDRQKIEELRQDQTVKIVLRDP